MTSSVNFHMASLKQLITLICIMFATVVLAESTLEIVDESHLDELYDQAGAWRKQIIDEHVWRQDSQDEKQGRIEWGADYSTYGSDKLLEPFDSDLISPEPTTIMRFRF